MKHRLIDAIATATGLSMMLILCAAPGCAPSATAQLGGDDVSTDLAKAGPWDPRFTLAEASSWWIEVRAEGARTMELVTPTSTLSLPQTFWSSTLFTRDLPGIAQGTSVRLVAKAADGTIARTLPFAYLEQNPALDRGTSVPPPNPAPGQNPPPAPPPAPPSTPEAPGGGGQVWSQDTRGMENPYFVNGYAGAFDQSPAGRSDSFAIVGGHDNEAPIRVGYGVLGQSSPLTTQPIKEGGRGTEYGSVIQDSVDYDFHAVFRAWDDSVQYWRLRPRRTGPGGAIAGFDPVTQFSLKGGKFIQYPAIDEVIDGAGRHRLVIFGLNNAKGEAAASMVVGVTTPGAGVDPFSESDFQGPAGEASFVSVGNVPKPGDNNAAYGSMITLAQHNWSRKIEVLAAAGQHGETGEMRRVTLTPSGSGWTAGPVHELPKGIGSIFAVAGMNDEVFWQWADPNGPRMRISRIDSNGNVIEDGVPSPHNEYEDYRSCHMAVAPDGRLMVIWYFNPGEIRTRVFNPSSWSWSPWKTIRGGTDGIYNFGPMQGLGSYQGRLWSGAVLAVDNQEALVSAASF